MFVWKYENNEKEDGDGPIFNKNAEICCQY